MPMALAAATTLQLMTERTITQTQELVVPKSIPITSPRSIGAFVTHRFVITDDGGVVSCGATAEMADRLNADLWWLPANNVENSFELVVEVADKPPAITLLRRKHSCSTMIAGFQSSIQMGLVNCGKYFDKEKICRRRRVSSRIFFSLKIVVEGSSCFR
jgi:hypothetical protein